MRRITAEIAENDPSLLEVLADDMARMESGDVTLIELAEIFDRSDQLIANAIAEAEGAEKLRRQAIANIDKESIDRTRLLVRAIRGSDAS
jgi:hypothetical protein